MIARVWHGTTLRSKANEYLRFLLGKGTAGYRKTRGNLSIHVWKKDEVEKSHFYTVTHWNNLDAVRDFAGNHYDKAVYYPEDDGMLLEFEENVNHYECYDVSTIRLSNYIKQFDQLFNGGSWQGESFKQKLKDVTGPQAFTRPLPDVLSLSEIIWHCTYWRTVLIKRMEGDKNYREQTVDKLNFVAPETLKERGWEDILNQFEETQKELTRLLGLRTDNFLNEEFVPNCTYEYLIEGVVQHDIYHLGQLGLVKKMLSLQKVL